MARLADTLYSIYWFTSYEVRKSRPAKNYARNTLRFAGFDGVRPGATDLHNLLASVERVPQAQVKRYLQDIVRGKGDTQADPDSCNDTKSPGARGGNTNVLDV